MPTNLVGRPPLDPKTAFRTRRVRTKFQRRPLPTVVIQLLKRRSVASVAKEAGLSPAGLALILRGERSPTLRSAAKIAEALEVSLEQFHATLFALKI